MVSSYDGKQLRLHIGSDNKIRVDPTLEWAGSFKELPIDLPAEKRRYLLMWIDMLRENRLYKRPEFETLGESLYSVLLDNEIGKTINRFLFEANWAGKETADFLRIELEFAENQQELAAWPWEYLFNRELGIFLAESSRLVLVRRITIPLAPRSLQIEDRPVRILFVAASPDDLSPVQFESVLDSIMHIRETTNFEVTTLVTPYKDYRRGSEDAPEATRRKLIDLVQMVQPHIIHFVGHGRYEKGSGQLALMGLDGHADWIDDHQFSSWLMDDQRLRLVFLQTCESGLSSVDPYRDFTGMANYLAKKNIPVIIAMQYQIQMNLANRFARAFYEALATSKTIGASVQEGRLEVQSTTSANEAHRYAFCLPVLYMNSPDDALLSPPLPTAQPAQTVLDVSSLSLQCPQCKHPCRPSQKYCGACGAALVCPKCQARIEQLTPFCVYCGAALSNTPPS